MSIQESCLIVTVTSQSRTYNRRKISSEFLHFATFLNLLFKNLLFRSTTIRQQTNLVSQFDQVRATSTIPRIS